MKDWKATPYPAHLHRRAHVRANRVANWTVVALVIGCAIGAVPYLAGRNDGAAQARAELLDAAPLLAASSAPPCAPIARSAELLEHVWIHRGQVIYRECIRVERPLVYEFDALPPVQTSALPKRGPK